MSPIEPEVKVASFQGPFGERSVNVKPTKIAPTAANGFQLTFPPMAPPRGVTLESHGAIVEQMAAVEDAIIVAGGLGSRMLPASGMVPKESLPLVDIPAISHLAREASHAGVKRIHIISSPAKDFSSIIADNSELENIRTDIDPNLLSPFNDVDVQVHVQSVARGLGDAINCALHSINGPFLVLLGDNIVLDNYSTPSNYIPSNASKLLVDNFQQNGLPCVGLIAVEDPQNYGIVSLHGNRITTIIEKPNPEQTPSNLALCGRYLFTDDTANLLNKYSFEDHGELQSIAIQKHWMNNNGLIGVEYSNFKWYDSGNPKSWIRSQIDYALNREDLADDLLSFISKITQR